MRSGDTRDLPPRLVNRDATESAMSLEVLAVRLRVRDDCNGRLKNVLGGHVLVFGAVSDLF